jgi:filamentous hemagglutinin family protein
MKINPFNPAGRTLMQWLTAGSLAVSLAALGICTASANPSGESVAWGQATFSRQGNILTVTNSPNTIINWPNFSIQSGELTRFIQQSSASSVLNRITGQDPSQILGALQSNGRVFLINPNGILFGANAQVNVAGLVASSLAISDADFLAGKNRFAAGNIAGDVSNQGAITTPSGGQVFLIAPNVNNSGIITSPEGEVLLAAGHSVQLADSTNPSLHVVVSSPSDQAINLGQVIAQGGRIGIYGALVNQRGTLNADSAAVGENGKIVLRASRSTQLEAGSVTTATGNGGGGSGEIQVLGDQVALLGNARVDASGQDGGGTILIGGDNQGKNADVMNARQTYVDKDATILADALVSGNGGKVIVWSDDNTQAYGSISVRGAGSGAGGFVETSGHLLDVDGIRVNAGSASGQYGTWLLDPDDINVDATLAATYSSALANIVLQADNISFNSDVTMVTPSISLTATATDNIAINASISNVGGDINLTSINNGLITQTAGSILTANNLNLDANGTVRLGNDNNVRGLSLMNTGAQAFNDVTFHNTGDLTLGVNGVGVAAGNTLEVTTIGTLSVAQPVSGLILNLTGASINVGNSVNPERATIIATENVDLHATDNGGTLSLAAGAQVSSNSVIFTADQMNFDGAAAIATTSSDSPPRVTLKANTPGRLIAIGAGAVDANTTLGLSATELGIITISAQGGLFIGNAGNSAAINVVGALDLATPGKVTNVSLVTNGDINIGAALNVQNLTLDAGSASGKIASTGSGAVTANSLTLRAGGGVGSLAAPFMTQVAALQTMMASGTGAIYLHNHVGSPGALTIGHIDSTATISIENTGPTTVASDGDVSGQGDVSLIAHSPLTINGAVNSTAGNVYLKAGSTGSIDDNLTIGSGATVSAGGNISLVAGNTITVDPTQLTHGGTLTNTPFMNSAVPTLSACIAAPSTAGCAAVLPTLSSCTVNPAIAGCSVVLPTLSSCVANPTAPGCSAILPSLASCTAVPNLPGCSVRLPTLGSCIANPTAQGCSVVLPSLSMCTAAPTTAGCGAVLPTLASCTANPAAPGCSVILPSLSSCTANPAMPGCSAVLPSVASCTASPTMAGCSTVLPTFAQCASTPTLAGCGVVLPPISVCIQNPSAAGCTVVLPPTASSAPGSAPLVQAINSTVNIINTNTMSVPVLKAPPGDAGSSSSTTQSTSADTPQKADTKVVATTDNPGVQNAPAKKMYCN